MARFPFFKEIAGKRALVVGGGEVALRRARVLAEFGVAVTAVSPRFIDDFAQAEIICIQRSFDFRDLDQAAVVVAATDDRILNAEIGKECLKLGIEVSVADDPAACTFHFPALVRRGELTIGISANGGSPVTAKYVRQQIENALPDRIEDVLVCMEIARSFAREQIQQQSIRAQALKDIFEYCLNAEVLPDEQILRGMIRRFTCAEMD